VTGAGWIIFPAHALLVVEERIRESEEEGVRLPEGVDRTLLALRILVCAEVTAVKN
jgi:hypothetical protein